MVSIAVVVPTLLAVSVAARGVAAFDSSDSSLVPMLFTARTLNLYVVSLTRFLIVVESALSALLGTSVQLVPHVLPVFVWYCHFVTAGPSLDVMEEVSVTCWKPAVAVGVAGFAGFLVAKVTSSISWPALQLLRYAS